MARTAKSLAFSLLGTRHKNSTKSSISHPGVTSTDPRDPLNPLAGVVGVFTRDSDIFFGVSEVVTQDADIFGVFAFVT